MQIVEICTLIVHTQDFFHFSRIACSTAAETYTDNTSSSGILATYEKYLVSQEYHWVCCYCIIGMYMWSVRMGNGTQDSNSEEVILLVLYYVTLKIVLYQSDGASVSHLSDPPEQAL